MEEIGKLGPARQEQVENFCKAVVAKFEQQIAGKTQDFMEYFAKENTRLQGVAEGLEKRWTSLLQSMVEAAQLQVVSSLTHAVCGSLDPRDLNFTKALFETQTAHQSRLLSLERLVPVLEAKLTLVSSYEERFKEMDHTHSQLEQTLLDNRNTTRTLDCNLKSNATEVQMFRVSCQNWEAKMQAQTRNCGKDCIN